MEGMTGIEAGERILNELPGTRILYLTTFSDDEYIFKALGMGAKGYILKLRNRTQLAVYYYTKVNA